MFIGMGFGASSSGYNAVQFDGVNDYLTKSTALTGAANGKQFTMSFWVRLDSTSTALILDISNGARIGISPTQLGIDMLLNTPIGGQSEAALGSVNLSFNVGDVIHVAISLDTSDTNKRHVVINEVEQSVTWSAYRNGAIRYTDSPVTIGATSAASNKLNGSLGEVYVNIAAYSDITQAANLEKFIKNGRAVPLGSSGELPTGSAPIIYQSGVLSSWPTNKGTGGGFTEIGELTTAASSLAIKHS